MSSHRHHARLAFILVCVAGCGGRPDATPSPSGSAQSALTLTPVPRLALGGQTAGAVSADFDGDGKLDLVTLYDYGNATAGLLVYPGAAAADGTRQAYRVWYSGRGNFDVSHAKIAAGDFNKDGKTDLVVLYDYASVYGWAAAGVFVFPGTAGKSDGASVPYRVWFGGAGSFDASLAKVAAGDFDQDGFADLIVLYDYRAGYGAGAAGLFVFPGTSAQGDHASQPYQTWFTKSGFDVSLAKIAAGDFNKDGKADLIALYDYSGSAGWAAAGLWVFPGTTGKATGSVVPYRAWYGGAGSYDAVGAKVAAGDFDGDGYADLITLYNYSVGYGPGSAGLIIFPGTAAKGDSATSHYQNWSVGAGGFDVDRTLVTAGDFDRDGKADLVALHDYVAGGGPASAGIYLLRGTATRGLDATTLDRYADPGAFDFVDDWWGLPGSFLGPPAAAKNSDGTVDVFAVGGDHTLYHARQTAPGGELGDWSSLGGSLAAYAPATVRYGDGRLEVFAVGSDGAVWHRAQTAAGSWGPSSWLSLGGSAVDTPAVALDQDGNPEVFVLAANSYIYYRRLNPGAVWTPWAALAGLTSAHAPAVAQTPTGQLIAIAVDLAGNVEVRQQSAVNGVWNSNWASFGAIATQRPVLASNGDGRLEAFIVGSDGRVSNRWQTDALGSWAPSWTVMGGSAVTQPPLVLRDGRQQLELVGLGPDGGSFYRVQSAAAAANQGGPWSADVPLRGSLAQLTAGALDDDGALEIYGRAASGALYRAYTVAPLAQPDFTLQVRHPLDGCLQPGDAESVRQRLLSQFGDRYPNGDVRERCMGSTHVFGFFAAAVGASAQPRAHQMHSALLGHPMLLTDGTNIAFQLSPPFIQEYAYYRAGLPLRFRAIGDHVQDPNGHVLMQNLAVDYVGTNTVITTVSGFVDVPAVHPSVVLKLTDQLTLAPGNIPYCQSQGYVTVGAPLGSESGPFTLDGGGVGCQLAAAMPMDLGIELPDALSAYKLVLSYTQPTVEATTGFTAKAYFQIVPRHPAVRVICPDAPYDHTCLPVQGGSLQFSQLVGIATNDLHLPLQSVQWSAPRGTVDSPTAQQTWVTFYDYGRYPVTVTVTDAKGVTVSDTGYLEHPLPKGGQEP